MSLELTTVRSGMRDRFAVLFVTPDPEKPSQVAPVLQTVLGLAPRLVWKGSSPEAMDVLDVENIDLLLAEISLGTVAGLMLVRDARARRPQLPIVSVGEFETLRALALEVGSNAHISGWDNDALSRALVAALVSAGSAETDPLPGRRSIFPTMPLPPRRESRIEFARLIR